MLNTKSLLWLLLILIPYHFSTSSWLLDICVDTRCWRSLNAAFMNCVLADCGKTIDSSRKNQAIHVLTTLSVFIYLKLTTTMISFQVQWYPSAGRDTLGIFGWGCAAGTLESLVYTRASSAEFCYPILD